MKQAYLGAVLLAAIAAAPAAADVKAGVEAWGRGEYARAVAEWRGPAAAGDSDAQFNLGQAYKLGRGVPVDQPAATEWFRKAATQGHAQAQDNYGLALFQDGQKAEALPWLEKSVARDEKRTELVLGTMLFNGDGVAKDWPRAYALVTRSSQQGLPQGAQTLARMDQYIPPAQRQQGLALARRIEAQGRAPILAAAPLPPPEPAAAVKPAARPVPPAPPPATDTKGGWRVQLGAFRDAANARALWAQIGTRVGGSPAYVPGAGIIRLQATGFASKAAATRACATVTTGCVVVAP